MAWARNVLRVNLSKGTCTNEPLNMEWAQKYLGQRGLATKYLVEETDPKVDPMSPDNKMIMATGPLTGTCASTAGRYSIITKGALTNAIACSNSGGFFGNEMKNAGYDMIIFEGKAKSPVYLLLENDNAQLVDAGDFWGKSCWDTEEGIKAKHQDPLLRIASIGVSGEKGVKFACVVNDMHRAAGRSGVGAVMGSKNLKAVAIRGSLGVQVENSEKFLAAVSSGKAVLAENPVTGQGLPTYGTQVLMNVINESGALPIFKAMSTSFPSITRQSRNQTQMQDAGKSRSSAYRTSRIQNRLSKTFSHPLQNVEHIDLISFLALRSVVKSLELLSISLVFLAHFRCHGILGNLRGCHVPPNTGVRSPFLLLGLHNYDAGSRLIAGLRQGICQSVLGRDPPGPRPERLGVLGEVDL